MKTDKKTILLVEDNPLVFSIYQTWLRRYGFKVEGAHDGEAALKQLPQLLPDLVVLDNMMPKLNGIEVLKFIRSRPELRKTPVLVLSNAFMEQQGLPDSTSGLFRQLHKSQCTPQILLQSVRELLGIVPPPGWQSAVFPPPASSPEPAGRKSHACVDGRCCRKYFGQIREASLTLAKDADTAAGADRLKNLYQHVQFMGTRAAQEGCASIAHLTNALEALLLEISLKKSPPPPSVLQTVTQAVDCLGCMFEKGLHKFAAAKPAAKALIVEDNPICNVAAMTAMKRAKFEAASVSDPQTALETARLKQFDVFLLDVNLPGMNGFELCKQLRLLPQYKKTPVIFVTSSSDFQKRAQAVLSGGNDLIAKPIWPQELALKTIMRLAESSEPPADKSPARPVARPAAVPALAKETPKATSPGHEKLVMAKDEHAPVATNRHAAKAPAGGNGSHPVPHHRPPGTPKSPTAQRIPFDASSLNRISPAGNGGNGEKPAGSRNGADPFGKITREIARIDASPVKRTVSTGSGGNREKPRKDWNEETPFDRATREITRILLGEAEATGMSLRLTRIALENHPIPELIQQMRNEVESANGSGAISDINEAFHQITREVARVIFGGENISEMHLHLTRIALERHRLPEILSPDSTSSDYPNSANPAPDDVKSLRQDLEDIKAALARRPPRAGQAHTDEIVRAGELARDALSARWAAAL